MKFCKTCKETKEYNHFHKNRCQKDGHNGMCKDCRKKYDKKWQLENRDKVLKWKREYNAKMSKESRDNKNNLNKIRAKRVKDCTPFWCNVLEMKKIYNIATKNNLVVDHIVPISNNLVCGLNVPENLRCISKSLNHKKYNKFNQQFISDMLLYRNRNFSSR